MEQKYKRKNIKTRHLVIHLSDEEYWKLIRCCKTHNKSVNGFVRFAINFLIDCFEEDTSNKGKKVG